jgi:hypothetical protein
MKILLVGPLGDAPREPARALADRLRKDGHDVDLHNPATDDTVIDYPAPYNPRTRRDTFLPSFLIARLRAFLRWRKTTRPILARYETVVVWDPLIAIMLRLAGSTRIAWSETKPVVDDAWNAVLVRLARALCHDDTVTR